MHVNGKHRAGTAIYSTKANEQCGLFNLYINDFTQYGVHFDGASCVSVMDLELGTDDAGVVAGIYWVDVANDNLITRVTFGPSAAQMAAGIKLTRTQAVCTGIHCEQTVDGILVDTTTQVALIGISGSNTVANVTTLIRSRSAEWIGMSLVKGNAVTNTIVDETNSVTITTDRDLYMNSGPSVTGSRGGNAALASLLTGLASNGLIKNNTTA